MQVKRIEISPVRQVPGTPLVQADLRLFLFDANVLAAGHAMLNCSVPGGAGADARGLVERLVGEAQRQMSRMPEYRTGQNRLTFLTFSPVPMAA